MLWFNWLNTRILGIVLLFYGLSTFSYSQSRSSVVLKDSVLIKINELDTNSQFVNGYGVSLFDTCLFLYPMNRNLILKYNITKKTFEKIYLDTKKNQVYDLRYIDVTKNYLVCINIDGSEIRKYDWNGTLIKKFKPKLFGSKYHLFEYNSFEYDETNDLYYIPIRKKFRESFVTNNPKKTKEYYKRKLIGVFNSNGKFIAQIGEYQKYYQNGEYYYADNYSFTLNKENKIVLSQQLSDSVFFLDYLAKECQSFSKPGKNINQSVSNLFRATQTLSNEEYYSNVIKAFGYYSTKQIGSSDLYIRRYEISEQDTTSATIECVAIKLDSKSCRAISQREINQKKIINDKLNYLQIFNIATNEIVYDGLNIIEGFVLANGVEKMEFWSALLTESELKLYKYIIKFD